MDAYILVIIIYVNKSYFRHSETFAPSKLIIVHQGIRFSRSRGPEEVKNDKFVTVGVPEAETNANIIIFAFQSCSDIILFLLFSPLGMDPAN